MGVVGHVERREQAYKLAGDTHSYVHLDDGTLGCTGNHRHVLQQILGEPADWYVILEDDAIPVAGFNRQLALALIHAPTKIVSLYLGTGNPGGPWQGTIERALHAADADPSHQAAWITSNHLLHAVGYAMHGDIVDDIVRHLNPKNRQPVDEQITNWASGNRVLVSYTHPSLVDHADGPTVIAEHADGKRRSLPRKAWAFGTRDNWHTRSVLL